MMNGLQLYEFLLKNLVKGQVLYISGTGGFHRYRQFLDNGNLQFSIPNNMKPERPNLKSIPQNIIVLARNIYHEVPDEFEQFMAGLDWGDCRNAILKRLVQLPDFLNANL